MSNIKFGTAFGSLFRFGWFVTAPVLISMYAAQTAQTTLTPKLKDSFKDLQATAVKRARAIASTKPGYYYSSGYSTKLVTPNNAKNLNAYINMLIDEMITRGYHYDTAGFNEYTRKVNKIPRFLKGIKSINNRLELKYHKDCFNLKQTLGELKGSCQELSTIVAISIASQIEKWHSNPVKAGSKVQNKIDMPEDFAFIESLPKDTKVKIVFGNMTDASGSVDEHALVELEFTNTAGKRRTAVIDPAIIFCQSTPADMRSAQKDYCCVTPEDYAKNLMRDTGSTFSPDSEIELKNNQPIENLYRDLYNTGRLYPETENYIFRQRTI